MREAELARDLVAALHAAGVDARAEGVGVHHHVEARRGARHVRIDCFWYGDPAGDLVLGMNPSNGRASLHRHDAPRYGAEYAVEVGEGAASIADGRTPREADAVACTRSWLEGAELDRVHAETPFLDGLRRQLDAIEARIDPRLPRDRGRLGWELWIYGGDRTCELRPVGDDVSCAFRIYSQQIALARTIADPGAAATAWLLDRVSISALARLDGVELERHAEVIEADPARWHWLHVRDRVASGGDVLAPMLPLIESLAASPIATRFFTFSSLMSLCFSSSSHFPWVTEGLPVVWPDGEGGYRIGETRHDIASALAVIEAALAVAPVPPFFGTARELELPALARQLAEQSSGSRPVLRQREQWRELIVETGDRLCTVNGAHVAFEEPGARLAARWPSLEGAARAIVRYLDRGATLDELARDPDAIELRLTRDGPG